MTRRLDVERSKTNGKVPLQDLGRIMEMRVDPFLNNNLTLSSSLSLSSVNSPRPARENGAALEDTFATPTK